jgi:hypothetical protein
MATKSFLKDISIKNRSAANAFIDALENSEKKRKKKIDINKSIESVKDAEKIKKIFGD